MGHPGTHKLAVISEKFPEENIPRAPVGFQCEACIAGKLTHKKPRVTGHKYKLGEMIHIDLV